jgi:hypothetical protein
MGGLAIGVVNPMKASGGCAPVSLLELATASGSTYLWSEQDIANAPSILLGTQSAFQGWVVGQPKFTLTGTTQTDTGSISIQNLSGNTVTRDVATAFTRNEFSGVYVYYRLWRGDSETAIFTFTGNVVDVELDEEQMTLSIEGFGNWSAIVAPAYNVDVSCPLFFGSVACGSTSFTPCQNTYGTCTSIERFAGAILQWDGSNLLTPATQIAQPPPLASYNPARAF